MTDANIDRFPLIKKYLLGIAQVNEQIQYHLDAGNVAFFEFWEPYFDKLNNCKGFESKILEIGRNPVEFFHILFEFKEAAFLKSHGFSVEFLNKGPDFIASKDDDIYCCEVKTIESVELDKVLQKLRDLNLPVSVTLHYSTDAFFDEQMFSELVDKIQERCKKSTKKSTEKVTVGSVTAELDFKYEGLVSGISGPSNLEKAYDDVWYSIHDHLNSALKNLSLCKESLHKVVVLNISRPEFSLYLDQVMHGKEYLIPCEKEEGVSFRRAYYPDGVFHLPDFSEIEIVVFYTPTKGGERLVYQNQDI